MNMTTSINESTNISRRHIVRAINVAMRSVNSHNKQLIDDLQVEVDGVNIMLIKSKLDNMKPEDRIRAYKTIRGLEAKIAEAKART